MAARAWPAVGLMVVFLACLPTGVAAGSAAPLDSVCIQAYGGLPDKYVLPDWLKNDVPVENLATNRRYDLLAGKLLYTGTVDGSPCPSYGLNPDGSPNGCGIELSQNAVNAWQNQFDPWIAAQSAQNGVPARVVKAVIAIESQFWPGSDWGKGEIGLGQMTEFGADLLLTWQADRYRQVCGQVFELAGLFAALPVSGILPAACLARFPDSAASMQPVLPVQAVLTWPRQSSRCRYWPRR